MGATTAMGNMGNMGDRADMGNRADMDPIAASGSGIRAVRLSVAQAASEPVAAATAWSSGRAKPQR